MSNEPTTDVFDDLMPTLSEQEQMFLYQLEVVGAPAQRAAEISGVKSPYHLLKKPHIIAAREEYRKAVRGRTDFTRDDVVAGYKAAIDQATVLADPMAQIAGWREIAKMKGYDKTPNINLTLTGTIEQMRRQIQGLSTEQLMKMAGEDVLDADFYRVLPDGATE